MRSRTENRTRIAADPAELRVHARADMGRKLQLGPNRRGPAKTPRRTRAPKAAKLPAHATPPPVAVGCDDPKTFRQLSTTRGCSSRRRRPAGTGRRAVTVVGCTPTPPGRSMSQTPSSAPSSSGRALSFAVILFATCYCAMWGPTPLLSTAQGAFKKIGVTGLAQRPSTL